MVSKKHFLGGMIIGIVLLVATVFSLPDGRLHIIFCDVGQGDSTYIRTPNNMDMLIDGGPNDKVLTCLGKHMPFYDREIDMVVLTHPQQDHMKGLLSVIERYSIKYFVIGIEGNSSQEYRKLVEMIERKKIPIRNLFTRDSFNLGEVKFEVLWPEREWAESNVSNEQCNNITIKQCITSDTGKVLGLSTDTDLNLFSYYLLLNYKDFSALFTGDGDSKIQPQVMAENDLQQVKLIKVPHHGSKTGMLGEFLDVLKPEEAVVSVGKNSYGHPAKEALNLLERRGIKVRRTDWEGDVEIVQ